MQEGMPVFTTSLDPLWTVLKMSNLMDIWAKRLVYRQRFQERNIAVEQFFIDISVKKNNARCTVTLVIYLNTRVLQTI